MFIDFHGSTGYGQAFTDSISGDWGGKPLEDLQKGLAAALERYPVARRRSRLRARRLLRRLHGQLDRGQLAGRASAASSTTPALFDHRSMYYTTEELWFPEWDHGGPYYENPGGARASNPAQFVKAWKTPMLVIHGALDYRVPYSQGLATFTALQRRGIESRFVYLPRREPLDPEAREQPAVARRSARLARPSPEVKDVAGVGQTPPR